MSEIGIGIIAFDRPDYLRQLMTSLEAQRGDDRPPVRYHLFQDGAINQFSGRRAAKTEDIQASLRVFLGANLPHKLAHCQTTNVGVGINQFQAYEYMAANYERIVVLEDDVVLSSYWLRLLPLLFDGLERRPHVFGFTTDFKRRCPLDMLDLHLGRVIYGTPHWWMIGFTPDRWEHVKPHYLEYYDLIRRVDYASLPHAQIVDLYKRLGYPGQASSQDGGKDMALWKLGMARASLVANRGISIGRTGVHFTPALHERLGYEDQEPYIFESDATRTAFEWPEADS